MLFIVFLSSAAAWKMPIKVHPDALAVSFFPHIYKYYHFFLVNQQKIFALFFHYAVTVTYIERVVRGPL